MSDTKNNDDNSITGKKRKLEETDLNTTDDAPTKKQRLNNPTDDGVDTNKENDNNQTTPNDNDQENDEKKDDEKDTKTKTKQTNDKEEMDQEDDENDNNNVKKEEQSTQQVIVEVLEEAEQETLTKKQKKQLREQIEFYFGNSNYSLDTHIQRETEKNDGYFPLANLMRFHRVASITEDVNVIIKIINESQKVQLNKAKDGLRRHPNMGKPPTKEEICQRTIFCKGFHPRYSVDQLVNYWKNQVLSPHEVLAVRPIKQHFSVGMGGDGLPKKVKRFMGDCSVEFSTESLAQEFSKLTFSSEGRMIVCGMYGDYYNDEIEWKITRKYYDFESNVVLYIYNIATYSTYCDVKNWICNALYQYKTKKQSKDHVAYVWKERSSAQAYVRFHTGCNLDRIIKTIKKKAFMGVHPTIKQLSDEYAKKIWKKVAEKKFDVNKDVEINKKPKQKRNNYHKKKRNYNDNRNHKKNVNIDKNNDDEDIDMTKKQETKNDKIINNENIDLDKFKNVKNEKIDTAKNTKNDKKHQLENVETPSAKKQRVE